MPALPISPVSFKHVIIDPQPNAGEDCCTDVCAVGDLNGDGFVDVVIGAEHATTSGLVWYEYPSWKKYPIASGEFTTEGQTADMDGDSDLDVAISDITRGIFWYENPGDSVASLLRASGWAEHFIGKDYGHDLEVGDLEGDGDYDIVICDKTQVVLWQQQSPVHWQRRVLKMKDGEGTALGDLDGDGDLDVIYGASWLEAPADLAGAAWSDHVINGAWSSTTRVRAADMNGDQRLDIILSVSEASGQVAWFEAPVEVKSASWKKHLIETEELNGAHSLLVADISRDGRLDVITAELHTSQQKRIIVYFNNEGTWLRQIIATTGSHNMRVADIGNDGDVDLIGKNYAGKNRVVEMWENQLQ
jgi:hypothetical protein